MNINTLPSGHTLVIFDSDDDLTEVYKLQDTLEKNSLIYVALDGTDDKYLHPDRFLVENYETDMESHLLYNDLILENEVEEYLISRACQFAETGKQMYIEEYQFTRAEPFYDYSK
jgi:hypothetical protein